MEYPKGYISDLPNCGIVAIAALTGQEYRTVWEWFRKKNKRPGQWRGATFASDYPEALAALGKKESRLIFEGKKSAKKIGQQRPMPLHYWVSIYSKKYPGKKFLVNSCNHTMAVENGVVLDQSGIKPVNEHKSKGRRITKAWIVE
jgi:hypothetical protein